MGKFMRRKPKTSQELSLIEVSSLCGVLTRAKSLALQKSAVSCSGSGSGSYIQLRSRRLVKPNSAKKEKEGCGSMNSSKLRGVNKSGVGKSGGCVEDLGCKEGEIGGGGEGSFGENVLEIEGRGRSTRETTPCSLIRDPDTIKIPGSSTKSRRPTSTKCRVENSIPIPSTSEMDEFFTGPEKQQQRLFIEKYNFDPVNDKPLPGRYEWVKLDATKKS